ncbi:MAG: sigma-54 dependent transcriptional regulator [Candidatus Acidiferrales bacterium]
MGAQRSNSIQPQWYGLFGSSAEMQEIYRLVKRFAKYGFPVLILGESGTGKELVARAMHICSPWHTEPSVPVDCAALAPALIESELFGYERGAFTGADRPKMGLLESANLGTIFLDEVDSLTLDMQARLLRVLQEREIRPVGSTSCRAIKGRIIAASNRDLEHEVEKNAFRQDLYFRLDVGRIRIPPLRDIKSDLPLLIDYFMEKYCDMNGEVCGVSDDAMKLLKKYDWPGNVRELENVIQRALAASSGPTIQPQDLLVGVKGRTGLESSTGENTTLREIERRSILQAVKMASGDKLIAARLLGIGKTTLYRKLKRYRAEGKG